VIEMNKEKLLMKVSEYLSRNGIRIASISSFTQGQSIRLYTSEKISQKLISDLEEKEGIFVDETENISMPNCFRYRAWVIPI